MIKSYLSLGESVPVYVCVCAHARMCVCEDPHVGNLSVSTRESMHALMKLQVERVL